MKTSKSGHLALSSPESGIQNPGTSESLQNLNEEESSSNCNLSKVLLYVLCPFYPLQQIICRRHRNTSQVEIIRVCNNSKGQENNGFIHQNQPVDIELGHDLQLTQTSLPNQLKHTTGNHNEILKYRKNEDEKWIKHRMGPCVLKFLLEKDKSITDTLHTKVKETMTCTHNKCAGSFMRPRLRKATFPARCTELALEDARDFLDLYYESIKRFNSLEHSDMWRHISESLEECGTYTLPYDLLVFGGKTAWRNAPRCIGRIQWSKLHVFDARHVKTSKEMFDALCKHIDFATNNGNLRAGVPDFRVWNPQLVQFAGYEQEDGSVVGDPSNVHFTKICERLGWKGKGGRFDVLPLVLQASGEEAQWFEIPPEKIILVPLRHPNYPWFEKLGLKWYALPAVANMLFDCAGLEYPAAPFNGWYMGTEIGARDMCDSARYNISETVAKHMGLDTSNSASLWKDEVLVQVNIAVLYSFQASNVTIVDHHTASESFMTHMEQEQKLRGGCPADWVWIVPPMSGSITPVFHQEMLNYNIKPLFEYQDHAWKGYKWTDERSGNKKRTFREVVWAVAVARSMMVKAMQARQKCTILFATETRKSARYAKILEDIFNKVFSATVYCMDEYDAEFLAKEKLVVIVTSTFGDGDPPDNGRDFQKHLLNVKRKTDSESYSVFALGSRAYPQFCAFGHEVDSLLHDLGATRVYPLLEGDELSGQDNSFKEWSQNVFKESCRLFSIEIPSDIADGNVSLYEMGTEWHEDRYKLSLINQSNSNDLCQDISHVHDRKVRYIKLISRKNLQAPESDRRTILLEFDTSRAPGLIYEPGDHLAIFPSNPADLVNRVLSRVCDRPAENQMICVKKKEPSEAEWTTSKRLPSCTLRKAVTHFLDITSTPTAELLGVFATTATSKNDRELLEMLSKEASSYEKWKYCCGLNIAEVLEDFPSVQITSCQLLMLLPLLQHRFYSISSSAAAHPGQVHATVAVLRYNTRGKNPKERRGLCSSWLNECGIGSEVPCFIRTAESFHMPDNRTAPILMIGPGTGIAPFRSFWQQRQHEIQEKDDNQPGGKMSLYFGCRQFDVDHIFKDELTNLVENKILDHLQVALSREPGQKKTYVQHLLTEDSADIYRAVVNGGHIYICGDAAMAAGVSTSLEEIMQREGKMNSETSKQFMTNLKASNRLHKDIFGVPLIPDLKSDDLSCICCIKQSSLKNVTSL